MIRKILVANRGEIACRIIRTCHALGLATVAVYSEADKHALHVQMADEAVLLGGSAPAESYLNIEKIIATAKRTGADAIHPGYGFLAENAAFAYMVNASGLRYIAPPAEAIEAMGDKRIAKLILKDVPFVAGYFGEDQTNEAFLNAAREMGFPIMVKASAGGGGKGMVLVQRMEDLPEALESARRTALQAFGDGTLMLEQAILAPRHIEVQVFGDQHGNVIAIGERECTIQRRHQKIIEETPSTALDATLRERMCATAISIAQQIGYSGAGTVEFLLDDQNNYYFMEMNTRLQVEHPVTEMVYGVDLVKWQIEVARNRTLFEIMGNMSLHPQGHAIEARVYAEDPAKNFLPVVGDVLYFQPPPHVRTDSGIQSGDSITPFYDPMIAKVIAHGENRLDAIRKLNYALSQMKLLGIRNNADYLRRILMTPEHLAGIISTGFVAEFAHLQTAQETLHPNALIAVALARLQGKQQWRNSPNRPIVYAFAHHDISYTLHITPHTSRTYSVTLGEVTHAVEVVAHDTPHLTLVVDDHRQPFTVVSDGKETYWAHTLQGTFALQWLDPLPVPVVALAQGSLRAPMTGRVIKVLVAEGDTVTQGTPLLIMEAMKMEHRIEAPHDGTVARLRYHDGDTVQADEVLLELTTG